MTIAEFLAQKPSLFQIVEFVETEAQRVAKERMKAEGAKNEK